MQIFTPKEANDIKNAQTEQLRTETEALRKIYNEELQKYKVLKEKIEQRSKALNDEFLTWFEETKKQRNEMQSDVRFLKDQKEKLAMELQSNKIDVDGEKAIIDTQIGELKLLRDDLDRILGENKRIYGDIKKEAKDIDSKQENLQTEIKNFKDSKEEITEKICRTLKEITWQKDEINKIVLTFNLSLQKFKIDADLVESKINLINKEKEDTKNYNKKIQTIIDKLMV